MTVLFPCKHSTLTVPETMGCNQRSEFRGQTMSCYNHPTELGFGSAKMKRSCLICDMSWCGSNIELVRKINKKMTEDFYLASWERAIKRNSENLGESKFISTL